MSNAPSRSSRRLATVAACTITLIAIGAIHIPWTPRPFDIIDFAEFLPFLRDEGGLVQRVNGFVGFYLETHGRFNLLSYAGLFAKWELFGPHPMAWHWARIAQMTLLVAMVFVLARRVGIGFLGAWAAAAVFIVARPSSEGWVRLTLGEPLGLMLMVWAMLLASRWREDPSSRRAWSIAGCVVAGILAKEMLAGLVPLIHLIAVARTPTGRLATPVFGEGSRRLAVAIWTPALLTFGIAGAVALSATGDGLTTLYGHEPVSLNALFQLLARPWQIEAAPPGGGWWRLPGNALLLLVVLVALWRTERGDGAERTHLRWMLLIALGTSAAHAILYLPWPWAFYYYAMPFLLGPALLFGASLTALARAPWPYRVLLGAGAVVALGIAATSTARESRRTVALQRVHGAVLEELIARPAIDSIFVMRHRLGRYSWMGVAPSLRNFALGSGMTDRMAPALDRTCAVIDDLLAPGRPPQVVISYLSSCGAFAFAPTVAIRDTFHYIGVGWTSIRPGIEVVGADLLELRPGERH